jgi:hypothetical protein
VFLIQSVEKKADRHEPIPFQPKTARGKRLSALLRRGKRERLPLLSDADIEKELATRKGRQF